MLDQSPFVIASIASQQTHALRQQLLRPHQSLAEMAYPGDDDSTSRHFGAHIGDGPLLGIVSIYCQPHATQPGQPAWQLRAMATAGEVRGLGLGRQLLNAAEAYARSVNPEGCWLWANARESALGFYQACGYRVLGELFEVPGVGPHRIIEKWLAK
ncbi:GNAT family N-acetyltransferase [Halioxenophilus sp. WMMB6]|uniref:GNAT family N-acetyltransferase n=1 Tax=Halioxenophilus sp. WMMB6 TaxID=3073815 RepID=UPI00295ED3AF|nr:GNAT family N-acetyltransferase [Halioxenophilus sp. WMMB6]